MKTVVSECPIEDVMRVLSGRWPTLLIYYLKDGSRRFSDLRRDNPSVSHRMLSLELGKLVQAGIVSRTDPGGYPRRVDYALTEDGEALVPLTTPWATGGNGLRRSKPRLRWPRPRRKTPLRLAGGLKRKKPG